MKLGLTQLVEWASVSRRGVGSWFRDRGAQCRSPFHIYSEGLSRTQHQMTPRSLNEVNTLPTAILPPCPPPSLTAYTTYTAHRSIATVRRHSEDAGSIASLRNRSKSLCTGFYAWDLSSLFVPFEPSTPEHACAFPAEMQQIPDAR